MPGDTVLEASIAESSRDDYVQEACRSEGSPMAGVIHDGVDYHCLFVRAMLPHRGETLRTREIQMICSNSGFGPMSVCLPNDHADGNDDPWCEAECAATDLRIFDCHYKTNGERRRGIYTIRKELFWCNGTRA